MSHSTVLVTIPGDVPEDYLETFISIALSRFDENTDVEPHRETCGEFDREHLAPEFVGKTQEEKEDLIRDWHGGDNVWYNSDTDFGYFSTYNPDSKWDWYQIGGRWTGFWKTHNGIVGTHSLVSDRRAFPGTADIARKGDIDFGAMGAAVEAEAHSIFDKYEALDAPKHIPWDAIRESFDDDKARDIYNSQPAVQAWREVDPWSNPDKYLVGRDAYVKSITNSAGVTFAVLHEGQWWESGHMGWFGMVSDENNDWPETWHKIIDPLSDDTWLAIVDVHI